MDAGHLSQTLQLVATSLGLSTWVSGAFYDDALNEVIGVDGVTESSLLYLSLGYPFRDNPRVSREEKMVRSERRKNG